MTTRECYNAMNENYDEVLDRIGSEKILRKFVIKFLGDKSYADLTEGLETDDGERAFRAAHTLKGICLNLGFTHLYQVSSDLAEKLRAGDTSDCEALLQKVTQEYQIAEHAIHCMVTEE